MTIELNNKNLLIAGVDEVGRGPLAGPVIAAAVILDPALFILGLADSKTLTAKKRELLAEKIHAHAYCYAIGRAEVNEIDELNILQASLLAMQRAILQLTKPPLQVLVDGKFCPKIPYEVKAIIRGDQSVPAISAASIIAKVFRDAEMCVLDKEYPGYGFAQHKGYGTAQHLECLKRLGASPIHRKSFSPVKQAIKSHELS